MEYPYNLLAEYISKYSAKLAIIHGKIQISVNLLTEKEKEDIEDLLIEVFEYLVEQSKEVLIKDYYTTSQISETLLAVKQRRRPNNAASHYIGKFFIFPRLKEVAPCFLDVWFKSFKI